MQQYNPCVGAVLSTSHSATNKYQEQRIGSFHLKHRKIYRRDVLVQVNNNLQPPRNQTIFGHEKLSITNIPVHVVEEPNVACEFFSPEKCFLGIDIQPGTEVGLAQIQPTMQQLWEEESNLKRCHDTNYISYEKRVTKRPREANVPQQQQIYGE